MRRPPRSGEPPRRITVANPSDGGFVYWLARLFAFAGLGVLLAGLYLLGGVYLYFASTLPPVPDFARYADDAPGITSFYGQDGTLLAELSREHREVVPLDRVPPKLIDAFVATEDRRFFSHGGVDYRGTLRALVTNLRAGQVAQGGSTITQQVAKSYLSSERSYSRKIREAIFARRIEARYSKRAILALYLNRIYLGGGAFGVQAAARRYFDKNVWDLDLGEMAMLGGLARAPSRNSPLVSMKEAMGRREQVLLNMAAVGSITEEEARAWAARPLVLHPRPDYFGAVTPYFTEHVRRELVDYFGGEAQREHAASFGDERAQQRERVRLGERRLYDGGYRVETTVLPWVDALAQENVDAAARKLDKRQGYRGPEAHLGQLLWPIFRERSQRLYGAGPLVEGKLYLGLVEEVKAGGAEVRVGAERYPLSLANMKWASRFSAADPTNDHEIDRATAALRVGDVVWVRWTYQSSRPRFSDYVYHKEGATDGGADSVKASGEATWLPAKEHIAPPKGRQELELEQSPRVEGALYTFDHRSGYVLAMVGGDDFDRSEFNRVDQACRQPGSAYKPIYYSLALDRGYSFDTEWNDKPRAELDPVTGQIWIPQNVDGSYAHRVTLEKALVWSKNPPSIEILETLGAKDVEQWARKLGFTTPIHADKALALGASCVHTDELSRAFAVFARGGRPLDTVYVRRVLDRHGRVLIDRTAWDDPLLRPDERLDRVAARFGDEPAPLISPRTAWLTSKLLREVVTMGHSAPIRATRVIAAGKTGTSSRTSDVWFVGYTSKWLTTAWMGDDTYERQLGLKDASFTLSVPLWARYMYRAVGTQPLVEIPWELPPGGKPTDRGGPLKPGFPPPPAPGVGPDGKPYALPTKLQGAQLVPADQVPAGLVPVDRAHPLPAPGPTPAQP